MKLFKRILRYLDPISHLGTVNYSFIFPLLSNVTLSILSEIFAYGIAKNPMIVGSYIIFINVAFIIYFAFRDGLKGGITSVVITICYYFYIIQTRHYTGQQLNAAIETTFVLAALYLGVAGIIGWLKQTIDKLIERESDEKNRLQTIVQQLPVGIIITNERGVIVQTNKQLETILGMKMPLGVVAGKDKVITALQDDKPVQASKSPLATALFTGKAVKDKEFVIERPDGKKAYIIVNASAIHNKSGKVIAAVSIITDITEKKEMELRKDDFVNMASHELKTPITSLKLYVELMHQQLKDFKGEKTTKILHSVSKQVHRLQDLVNDMLDVSRLQTGKLSFNKEKCELNNLIEENISELQGTTNQQPILFKKTQPVSVYADTFRISQVLINLITNASKYSPAGSDIEIKLRKEDNQAIISVKDHGIGIEKDQQKKIFERLYQVSGDKEKTFPGLGMGLYISQEIIKRHKGDIWVESEKGTGSTFYFSLPLYQK